MYCDRTTKEVNRVIKKDFSGKILAFNLEKLDLSYSSCSDRRGNIRSPRFHHHFRDGFIS